MQFIEDAMFDAEAIRDTSSHNSNGTDAYELPVKTLIIQNTLDQIVTLQLQGSRDNVNFFNVGNTFDVAAGAWYWQSCDTFFPFGRIVAQCAVAPTTGGLSVWCEKVRGG